MASEPLKASNSPCFTQWDAYQSRKSPTDSAEEADKMSSDKAIQFKSGVILAFRLNGKATDVIESWSAGIRWPGGWSLHFHLDPEHFDWPNHPKVHYQFTCPDSSTIVSTPPYANLRPPADVGAIEWIEWALSMMA
jgi:hypothetical protein